MLLSAVLLLVLLLVLLRNCLLCTVWCLPEPW
jgi:hypothetical protein